MQIIYQKSRIKSGIDESSEYNPQLGNMLIEQGKMGRVE